MVSVETTGGEILLTCSQSSVEAESGCVESGRRVTTEGDAVLDAG